MNRTGFDPDGQLEASLRRINGALDRNRNEYAAMVEQIMADTRAEVAERVSASIAEGHQRRTEQWQRRDARRRERRRQSRESTDVPRGIVFLVTAIVCLAFAIREPVLWWMIFVAFGFGMSAASAFRRSARAREAEPKVQEEIGENTGTSDPARSATGQKEQAPPAEPADPRVARIHRLCEKILAELESGPPVVREVVTQPEATVGGLRQACLEIARREHELRSVLAAQDEAGLLAERDVLVARVANEQDEIVRDRLGQALRALEQQLAHRAELTTAATRLEAENTRILYTLENLHMQLLRARSTDLGAPELGGKLRESLGELGTEIDSIAEALEFASAPAGPGGEPAPTRKPNAGAASTAAADADAQRAERQAAARRAEQAREAQRH